jgi:hypothetical protein
MEKSTGSQNIFSQSKINYKIIKICGFSGFIFCQAFCEIDAVWSIFN